MPYRDTEELIRLITTKPVAIKTWNRAAFSGLTNKGASIGKDGSDREKIV
ncbi:MAG: hypothetical protein R3B84_16255 [Zavarzinella sp.]